MIDGSLESRMWQSLGYPHPSTVSVALGKRGIENKLRLFRAGDYAIGFGRNLGSASANYFLGNIPFNPPWISALGLGLTAAYNYGLEYAVTKLSSERKYLLNDPFLERAFFLAPYHQHIKNEFSNRGYPHEEPFNILWNLNEQEGTSLGMQYLDLATKPLSQIAAAAAVLPLNVIAAVTASVALLMYKFGQMGLGDQKIDREGSIVNDAITAIDFSGLSAFKPRLSEYRSLLRAARQSRKNFENAFSKLSMAISGLSMFFLEKSEFLAMYFFTNSMLDLPTSYRNLTKNRLNILRNISETETLCDVLNGKPYLLTDESWDTYRKGKKLHKIEEATSKGVYIRDFQTKIPDIDSERRTPSLNADLKQGKIYLLEAGSGEGKTVTTQLGMAGIVETVGDIVFIDGDGKSYHIEDFTAEELRSRVIYIGQPIGFLGLRVADIFNEGAAQEYMAKIMKKKPNSKEHFVKLINSLDYKQVMMLTVNDVHLEVQLAVIAKSLYQKGYSGDLHDLEKSRIKVEGESQLFPNEMFDELYKFREFRKAYVMDKLKGASNLKSIDPGKDLGQLSSGQYARVMFVYNKERYGKLKPGQSSLIIFDQTTDPLDPEAKLEVMVEIEEMMKKPDAPHIISISQSDRQIMQDLYQDDCEPIKFGEYIKSV